MTLSNIALEPAALRAKSPANQRESLGIKKDMIKIRKESQKDIDVIRQINEQAFGQSQEANIIDKLRDNCCDLLSLVVLREDKLVGHILFSPAAIEGNHGIIKGMALGPMAVIPEYQGQGIGSAMVKEGIQILKESGCPFIIVLGHPEYYPRFGFKPASRYEIRSQWEGVPDEVFMILWLNESKARGVSGIAKYRQEFDAAR